MVENADESGNPGDRDDSSGDCPCPPPLPGYIGCGTGSDYALQECSLCWGVVSRQANED